MKLYIKLISASIRSRMQYKMNFIFSMVSYGVIMMIDFVLLAAILNRFDQIKGWNIYEVGVLYAISSISLSLYRTMAPEIHEFEKYMIEGEFDSLLIRPVSPLVLLLSKNLDLSRIGGVLQGLLILCLSLYGLSKEQQLVFLIAYLPVILVCGWLISFSLALFTATIAFWTQRIKDFQTFTLYAPFNAANYPMNIYPGWLKIIFFTVIPVAFMNYVPMLYLLHKGGSLYFLLLPAAVAGLFFCASLKFWNYGIKFYHSTGT
ncbi:ABC-2 family transporter protein [Fictibacillus sp. KIGAM418]|uniref:ABC-2 family transporter protein n=1 Tax=Fictibacillus marinisediminis TaxID=2878389 RepID=A0A9X1X9W4_9BACL|nr:ABC-2 family transporter protein [Fictibacillus marinisediminis]MCK6256608.1 ABC-2 family transporter protein [Fictibacillus marinisediminis]